MLEAAEIVSVVFMQPIAIAKPHVSSSVLNNPTESALAGSVAKVDMIETNVIVADHATWHKDDEKHC